ncbi:hypothetical protein ACTNEO_05120 [Gracilibacillus sp. HCP3S3_G5_1]
MYNKHNFNMQWKIDKNRKDKRTGVIGKPVKPSRYYVYLCNKYTNQ